jgi:predicted phage terminase large subunit-like protein
VLIEDKASGTQLAQQLLSEGHFYVKTIEPAADKITRMQGQSVLIENGMVLLPSDAAWCRDYVRELIAFPHGRYDDQVDSTSQALAWFNPRVGEPALLTYYRRRAASSNKGAA